MTAAIVTDLEQTTYDRQRAVRQMVTAVRAIPHAATRDDHVIGVGILHPHALTAPELAIAAELERRADQAIAQIRAEHQRMRDAIQRGQR